jgi:hypothetical protein
MPGPNRERAVKRWGLVLMLIVTAGASAADRGFYVGGGWSSVDARYAPSHRVVGIAGEAGLPEGAIDTVDLDPLGSSAWRVMAGYRVLDWLAVEGNFSRFGGNSRYTRITCVTTPCPAREAGDADTTALSALALYPLGPFDLFAKVGVTRWRAALGFYNPDGSRFETRRDDGTDVGYGGGVQFRHSRVQMRLEFERAKFGDDRANLLTLGVACVF